MKKNYKIAVSWEMYGEVDIEAESLEEALEIAAGDDIPLPLDKHYVDGSWMVDRDGSEQLNNENEQADTVY